MTQTCLRTFGQVRGPARVLSCVLACLVLPDTANAQAWWDANWNEREKLPFENADQTENLVDFPVLVVINSDRIDYTKTLNAGEDLRFIDADGSTVLNHEIEQWNESGTSYVWVKVPQVDGSSTSDHVWMYYDNTSAADAQDPAGVWTNGYVGVWHLNEDPSGGVESDSHESPIIPWWNGSWTKRTLLTFDNSGQTENLVNFPVLVKLDSSRIEYADTQNLGQDLRFVDADGSTVLDHEIEEWNESGTSYVWVEIPQIDGSSSTDYIWMYYGNSGASDGQDAQGAWNASYEGVYHLHDDYQDSTSNGHHGTNQGAADGAGMAGDGADFELSQTD